MSIGDEIYQSVEPVASPDLNIYAQAIGLMFQTVADYARDSDDAPGWTQILDPVNAPDEALPWLAGMSGSAIGRLTPLLTIRELIADNPRVHEGTPDDVVAAVKRTLTGNKIVLFRERDTSEYHFTIITFTSETPDTTAVIAAVDSHKPGGLRYTFVTVAGATYIEDRTTYATYSTLKAAFLTYNGVRNNVPGT